MRGPGALEPPPQPLPEPEPEPEPGREPGPGSAAALPAVPQLSAQPAQPRRASWPRRYAGGVLRFLNRPWLLAFVGFFLVSTGWAFASPMSSSPDEPSHMVKAAATARGEFVNSTSRHEISGGFEKTWLGYPLPAKYGTLDAMSACFRFRDLSAACGQSFGTDNTTAIVETSAGNYNPAYYLPVGLPSLVLPGVSALYGMRLASALLNSGLLAAAVGIAAGWRRPGWPLLGVIAAGTPMVLFLSGTVNSNGMEATAAVLAWTAAMSLALDDDPKPGQVTRRAIGLAIGGALLANTRSLGIAFVASILVALIIIAGPRKIVWLARFRAVQIMAGILILGGVAAFLWNQYADTLSTSNLSFPNLTPEVVFNQVFWSSGTYITEIVGELGWLDVALPPGTIIAWYAVAGLLILCGLGVARWREAAVIAALTVGTVAIPIIAQLLEAKRFGIGWQGRYILAWVLGLPVLTGLLMARRLGADFPHSLERRAPIAAAVVLGLAGLGAFYWSMIRYAHGGLRKYGITPIEWFPPGGWIAWWIVYSIGLVILVVAVAVRRRDALWEPPPAPDLPPAPAL